MEVDRALKVLTIFGTRPEVIKLFPVLKSLQQDESFQSIIVSTSQHREMIDDLLTLFSVEPDHDLNIIQPNQSLAEICTRSLSGLDLLFKQYQPDLALVQGDTTTAFIGALAASFHRVPVGHVEAGLRSLNKKHPYPEEINRRLISVVGDLHFAPTAQNAQNLYKEGIDPSNVFVTGNTVIDSLSHLMKRPTSGQTGKPCFPAKIPHSHRMILVTAHRRENWGKPLENLCHALTDIVELHPDVEIVYPVHLNPRVKQTVYTILENRKRVHLIDPLPYGSFVQAMVKAHLIITDSGGIQEEGPTLRKPVLVFRKVTERQEGLQTGGVKLTGLRREAVVLETSRLLENPAAYQEMIATHNPFGDGNAAVRIVQAILHHFKQGDRPEDFNSPTTIQRSFNTHAYTAASK